MKISQLDMLTACWHTAQHNSDYSKSNIGKIEHEWAKYIQNNHNLSKEEFFLKYINRTINISFIPTSDAYKRYGDNITISVRINTDAENIIKSYCANEKCSFGRITINATSPTLAKDKLTELAEIGFSTQDIAEIYCCWYSDSWVTDFAKRLIYKTLLQSLSLSYFVYSVNNLIFIKINNY